jgi:hypothetical protein
LEVKLKRERERPEVACCLLLLLVHLFLIFSDMGKKLRKVIHKKEHREN